MADSQLIAGFPYQAGEVVADVCAASPEWNVVPARPPEPDTEK
jgi:hypothetical protein